MPWRCLLTILFGLFVIWTGLLRSIEAHEFKPNAFWFCLLSGLLAVAAGFLFRLEMRVTAVLLGLVTTGMLLAFYLNCFVTQPEKDATYRVGLVIVACFGELCVLLLPRARSLVSAEDSGAP